MNVSGALWIATGASLFITAYYCVRAAHIWFRSRSVLGPISFETRETLRRLINVSQQGPRLTLVRPTLFYFGLGVLCVAIAAKEWLCIVVAAVPFARIVWVGVRTTTAPVVLILGTSTHSSIRRQRIMKNRLSPLRVVSLLDVNVPWDTNLSKEMGFDCFRTTNEGDWWLVITKLMQITPILAIDAAAETDGVLREGHHILSNQLWPKCLFLTPPDGFAPILDRLLPIPGVQQRELRIACYEEAVEAIDEMVANFSRR